MVLATEMPQAADRNEDEEATVQKHWTHHREKHSSGGPFHLQLRRTPPTATEEISWEPGPQQGSAMRGSSRGSSSSNANSRWR